MLAERPHDVLVVILERKTEIADAIVEQAVVAEMAAEHVAGEQHRFFIQIGTLGVRPVQKGGVEKSQRAPAQLHRVAGIHRRIGQVFAFQQALQHGLRLHRDNQPRVRRPPHQFRQRAGVVGFQMVENDDGDFVVACHLFQSLEERVRELRLHRVDHRHPRLAAHAIGVVGSAIGGFEDDVEHPQLRVEGADPEHAGGEGDGLHAVFASSAA